VIFAQFGKDLFNISKVIGRKKWPSFLTHSVEWVENHLDVGMMLIDPLFTKVYAKSYLYIFVPSDLDL